MSSYKLKLILMLIASGVVLNGCSLISSRKIEIPIGSAVEVAAPATVEVYITNEETGTRERRALDIVPDGIFHIGRIAPKVAAPEAEPTIEEVKPVEPERRTFIARVRGWFSRDKGE